MISPIRLLLVEDNVSLRAAMKAGLEDTGKVTVIAETARGEDAIGLALDYPPDVILMDVQLAGAMNGVQAAIAIRREIARLPVVFYSIQDDERFYRDFLASGILTHYAYVRKSNYLLPAMVVPLLRDAIAGRSFIDPDIEQRVQAVRLKDEDAPLDLLEPNERDVVKLLAQGSFQSTGDQEAVTLTIDDFGNGTHRILNREFRGVRQDLLTLEDEIFKSMVEALVVKPSNDELARTSRRPTEDIKAYDLYLRGRNVLRGVQTVKNTDEALGLFEQAIKLDASFALAYTGLADAYIRKYNLTKDAAWPESALNAAQQGQRLNDNLPEVHNSLGRAYTLTGRTAAGIAELQHALELAPNSDDAYRRLGGAYSAAGRQQEAIAAFDKAIRVNPYFWNNYNSLGNLYFTAGQNEQALKMYQRVVELEPDRTDGYVNTGAVYYRLGKWDDCLRMFQKALELQPTALNYSNLGTTYFFLGRYSDAVAMFEKATAIEPNDPARRGNLADALRWSNQPAKAKEAYDQAITLAFKAYQVNSRDASNVGNLALYYAKTGNGNQALDFIRRAREIDPKSNALMYDEATIHALANQMPEAMTSLEAALRSGYSLKEVQADPELKALRETTRFGALEKELTSAAGR